MTLNILLHILMIIFSAYILVLNINKINFFVALNLVMFWLLCIVYHIFGIVHYSWQYSFADLFITNMLILVYIFIFLLMTKYVKVMSFEEFEKVISEFSPRYLHAVLLIYLAFKAYLISKYNLLAANLLANDSILGAHFLEVLLDTLLTYPALGAFFLIIARMSFNFRANFKVISLILCTNFALFHSVVPGGARRFAASVILFCIFIIFRKRRNLHWLKAISVLTACIVMFFAFSVGYQKIRGNFELTHKVTNIDKLVDISTMIFLPTAHYNQLRENFIERESPYKLFYKITYHQMRDLKIANGLIFSQSFYNAIPEVLLQEKGYLNIDTELSAMYGLNKKDLGPTMISILQSELSFIAYVVSPIVYLLLFKALTLVVSNVRNAALFKLSILGLLFLLVFNVETSLTAIITGIRNLLLIGIICLAGLYLSEIANVKKSAPLS